VPSVPSMFGYYFPDAAEIRANPKGHVIIADGRNHIELTDKRYDIIVTDPPPPVEASGISVISSLEYYQAGHARLKPGGIMMQWVPYGATIDEFKAHVRSFKAVFPHVKMLFGPGLYGMYMMGSDEPMAFDDATIREVLGRPGILEDISSAYDSNLGLPGKTIDDWVTKIHSLEWIADAQVDAFTGTGPLITDDRPLPEYFLLRRLFDPNVPQAGPQLLRSLAGG
jgi:spermidine synthase